MRLPKRSIPCERAEHRLFTSLASKHPEISDWVYNHRIFVTVSYGIILVMLYNCFDSFNTWLIRLRLWTFVRQGSSIDNEDLANDFVMAAIELAGYCWTGIIGLVFGFLIFGEGLVCSLPVEYLAEHWRLGKERSKNVETRIADARRWSGEMSS